MKFTRDRIKMRPHFLIRTLMAGAIAALTFRKALRPRNCYGTRKPPPDKCRITPAQSEARIFTRASRGDQNSLDSW
jgi:hypothetical protein